MSENISLRLPQEILQKLDDLAQKEHKDRSTLIRELLDDGIKDKRIDLAAELYRKGEVTGWQAAKLAGISLRRFHETLHVKGILIQYGERDLEQDLRGLRGE